MKKFLALYMAPTAAFEKMMNAPHERQDEGMREWETWMKKHSGDIADMGAPLGKTKKIDADEIADMRNTIGGYSVVQADSLADAAKLFENHAHFKMIPGAWIEVMECLPMPGM